MTTALLIAAGWTGIAITATWIAAHRLADRTCPCGNHQ